MSTKPRSAKRSRPVYVIEHDGFLIENFQCSSQGFYQRVEAALEQRKIPELKVERVEWPQGGVLSARREYLRAERERYLFDICGAPFGTGFFVSNWFAIRPPRLGLVLITYVVLLALVILDTFTLSEYGAYYLMWINFRMTVLGTGLFLAATMFVLLLILLATGLIHQEDFDALLFPIPVVSDIYIRYVRRMTYYKTDTAMMYQQAVHNAVMQVVEEMTGSKGIKPLENIPRGKPVLKELFKCGRL